MIDAMRFLALAFGVVLVAEGVQRDSLPMLMLAGACLGLYDTFVTISIDD